MIDDWKSSAIRKCIESKSSLTPNRLKILEAMQSYNKPVSAYDLHAGLDENDRKLNIATVYRVIKFWCKLGIIHKISALNKFTVCTSPEEKHTHITNFCRGCESVFETCNERMGLNLEKGPESMGLTLSQDMHLEIPVLCGECN